MSAAMLARMGVRARAMMGRGRGAAARACFATGAPGRNIEELSDDLLQKLSGEGMTDIKKRRGADQLAISSRQDYERMLEGVLHHFAREQQRQQESWVRVVAPTCCVFGVCVCAGLRCAGVLRASWCAGLS